MENIEKKLCFYCFYNKETKIYDTFYQGYDDKQVIDTILSNLGELAYSLCNDASNNNYEKFISRLEETCIYKVGYFDNLTGEFINDKLLLVDLINEDMIINAWKKYQDIKDKFKNMKEIEKNESK